MDSSVRLGCRKHKDCTAETWFLSRNNYGVPNARLLCNLLYFYAEAPGKRIFFIKHKVRLFTLISELPQVTTRSFTLVTTTWAWTRVFPQYQWPIPGQWGKAWSKIRMKGMFCYSTYCTRFQSSGQGCERTWTAGWQSDGSSPHCHPRACSEF